MSINTSDLRVVRDLMAHRQRYVASPARPVRAAARGFNASRLTVVGIDAPGTVRHDWSGIPTLPAA